MIVCAYEDRPNCYVGLKLLVLSLAKHCPGLPVHVYLPQTAIEFRRWASGRPTVEYILPLPSTEFTGWDVKPGILLDCLAQGHDEVWWMDSDLLATRDWRRVIPELESDRLVIAEERASAPGHDSPERTIRLGLTPARTFRRTMCACVLRVTTEHKTLLREWQEGLRSADYRHQQQLDFDNRDWALGSDQEVLVGLLGSTRFAHIAVHTLRSGREIAQCFCGGGYAVPDRIRNMGRGLPALVHAQGPKPWELQGVLFAELSPYSWAALEYSDQLGELTEWIQPRRPLAKFLQRVSSGNPNLRDLPCALWAGLKARVALANITRYLQFLPSVSSIASEKNRLETPL